MLRHCIFFIFSLFLMIAPLTSYAGYESEQYIQIKDNQLLSTSPFILEDSKGSLSSGWRKRLGTSIDMYNKSVKNTVALLFREENIICRNEAFTVVADLSVKSYDQDKVQQTQALELSITYDPSVGAVIKDEDIFKFEGAHRIEITINEIEVIPADNSVTIQFSDIQPLIEIRASYEIERYENFSTTSFIKDGSVINNILSTELGTVPA